MLDEFEFARKDFKNRRLQPILAFLGLVICVASTLFLISLGQSIGLTIALRFSGQLTSGLSHVISTYVSFVSVLVFLTGMFVTFFLFSSMMAERIRDIGLIKSIGSVETLGYSYVMSGPVIIIVAGCLLGALFGFVSFIIVAEIFLQIGFLSKGIVNLLVFFVVPVLSILFAWFIAAYHTEKAFKITSVNLLAGDIFNFDIGQLGFIEKFVERLPLSIQFVAKSMFRSRSKSKIAIICLIACILLATVSFVGGFVSWYTTRSYTERAFGQNVLAIGSSTLVNKYVELMTPHIGTQGSESQSSNLLNSEFYINDTFIERLGLIHGVEVIDRRLLSFTQVAEVQNVSIETDEDGKNPHYVTYGDHRQAYSLVVGLDPDNVVSDLLSQKGFLNSQNLFQAVIGDTISGDIFDNPYKQNISVFSNDSRESMLFKVISVSVDPINNGYVVYVPFKSLQKLNSVDGFNLVLVKLQTLNSEVISEITSLSAQYNVVVSDLDVVRGQSVSNLDRIWMTILPFPMLSLMTLMISLLNCMLVSVSSRLHDFGVLRSIGAKPNYVSKLVFIESLMFIILTAPVGILIGMIFNFVFLIPEPTLSIPILITSLLGLSIVLIGMCALSTFLVVRLGKQPSIRLLREPT